MNIESVWSGGGRWWEHFTGSPPARLPSIPAVGVSEGGGGGKMQGISFSTSTRRHPSEKKQPARWNPIGRV